MRVYSELMNEVRGGPERAARRYRVKRPKTLKGREEKTAEDLAAIRAAKKPPTHTATSQGRADPSIEVKRTRVGTGSRARTSHSATRRGSSTTTYMGGSRFHAGSEKGKLDHTEYEGPSLREKLEKLRRGHSVPRKGTRKHPTVQGGWLSEPAKTAGAGRVIVGSWAQKRHRDPGSKGDAPITYADK